MMNLNRTMRGNSVLDRATGALHAAGEGISFSMLLAAGMLAAAISCARAANAPAAEKSPDPSTGASAAMTITDFSKDLPTDDRDATITLRFLKIRPMKGREAGDVAVQLQRRDGAWLETGHRAAADYNQNSPGNATIDKVDLNGDKLSGTIHVTIDKDRPKPSNPKEGFPDPSDQFDLKFEATIDRSTPLPYQADPEAFMPPWRKDMPRYGGPMIAGTYTGTHAQGKTPADAKNPQPVAGKILGAIAPAPTASHFGTEGNIDLAARPGGGASLIARLSPSRIAGPEQAKIVRDFATPLDLSKYAGLRVTVAAPKRRDDAGVAVGLREADGTWYTVAAAAPLLGLQNGQATTIDVPFSDFRRQSFDENYFLDVDAIASISLGIDNPLGVGDVMFDVLKVDAYGSADGVDAASAKHPDASTAGPVVELRVDPATAISINGASAIPKGLFGFHDVGQANAAKAAQAPAGKPDPVEYIKLLNPGYLRTLDHVGFGGKPITDDQIKAMQSARADTTKPTSQKYERFIAGNALDNIVSCHTVDLWARPPWMEADMDKFLGGVKAFYRDQGAKAWTPGEDFNPLRRFEVWNEPFMWGRHMNMGPKTPARMKDWEDPTQFGYIPAKVGMEVYTRIFEAAVEGAKSANPNVLMGGPSAPSFESDDYSNFFGYVSRFIDASHDRIDFLTEHHYSGEPDSYAASYIVASAYGRTKYNKAIPIYNTECNDLTDPATRGDDGMIESQKKLLDLNRAHYNITDIMECIRVCPDVLLGRAMHALWSGYCNNMGEQNAYTLMNQLRGKMILAGSSDPAIRILAASPSAGELVIFCFNNSPHDRAIHLSGVEGFTVKSMRLLDYLPETGTRITDLPGLPEKLTARSGLAILYSKPGYEPTAAQNTTTAYVDLFNAHVAPGAPAIATVRIAAIEPKPKAAFLRIISRNVDRGEAVARINGKEIALPWSSSNDACALTQDVPIDPSLLSETMKIEFGVTSPDKFNGYTIYAAGVGMER